MAAIRVLAKGQITLPRQIRKEFRIHEGDMLVLEKTRQGIILKKGKTILDYAGTLPDMGLTIEEMREKAIHEAAKDHG